MIEINNKKSSLPDWIFYYLCKDTFDAYLF